ncbi:MAG TPA: tetratricopeptide repeat protein [Myxococcota bacterium]|jgi:tetratricopeptide (TPR) repeat protein
MLALVLLLQVAGPDADVDARRYYAEGKQAYDLGHFDQALSSFESAYKAKPLPGFLFNLGQCHLELGHYERAEFFYQRYLDAVPSADNRAVVEELIAEAHSKAVAHPAPSDDVSASITPWLVAGIASACVSAVVIVVAVAVTAQPRASAPSLGTLDRGGGA